MKAKTSHADGLKAARFFLTLWFCVAPALQAQTQTHYAVFDKLGLLQTRTRDGVPYAVDLVIGYEPDEAGKRELLARRVELQDFVRYFFSRKYAAELQPEHEEAIKQELMNLLNTQVLSAAKVGFVIFRK